MMNSGQWGVGRRDVGNFQVVCCLNGLGQALPFLCFVKDATCTAGCSFSLGPPSSARFLYSKVRHEFTDSSAQGPHLIGSLLDPDTQRSDVL